MRLAETPGDLRQPVGAEERLAVDDEVGRAADLVGNRCVDRRSKPCAAERPVHRLARFGGIEAMAHGDPLDDGRVGDILVAREERREHVASECRALGRSCSAIA